MVKKTIKYTDYNGVEREEDFYFHLTSREIIAMEHGDSSGSLMKKIEGIVKNNNAYDILDTIEWFVRKSYGVRTEDGRGFRKTEEAVESFLQSAAYEEFYVSFLEDPEGAGKFIESLIPKRMPKGVEAENLPS